jgi:hypothetical protein
MSSKTLVVVIGLGILALVFLAARGGLKLFAEAIAFAEGYGRPGAIPTVRNNPGDLKLDGATITYFPTPAEGWAALYRQLQLIVSGASRYYSLDMTIADMGNVYTATESSAWSLNVASYLRSHGFPTATTQTTLREVLV